MRNAISTALMASMLCLTGIARDAGADITISLVWGACGGGSGGCSSTGSNTIIVGGGGGQTLRLDVYLSHDLAEGLFAHTFSLNFDTALNNFLDLGPMASVEWVGSDVYPGPHLTAYEPLTPGMTTRESTLAVAGRINSIESAGFQDLPANGQVYSVGTFTATAPAAPYRVAQIFFTATGNAIVDDGGSVFSGLFNTGFDQFLLGDELGTVIAPGTVSFGSARVHLVPEPGTLALLAFSLVGLGLARRHCS